MQREASSQFPHARTFALGDYRGSPFITGHTYPTEETNNGLKTEILNYETGTWVQADDYPFSTGNEYVPYNERCMIVCVNERYLQNFSLRDG